MANQFSTIYLSIGGILPNRIHSYSRELKGTVWFLTVIDILNLKDGQNLGVTIAEIFERCDMVRLLILVTFNSC